MHSHETRFPGQSIGSFRSSPSQALPKFTARYVRHRPETSILYQVIQEYWPEFQAELASHGKYLPAYITQEFDEYLKCGRLEHGFLRVRCETCHHEKLVAFSWPLLRIIASIEDPAVINQILAHLVKYREFDGAEAPEE